MRELLRQLLRTLLDDYKFSRSRHVFEDQMRRVDGELRLLTFEQARLRKRVQEIERLFMDDGK